MKRKNSSSRKLILLLVLVVGISIGYAALASNLKINGTTGIKNATWNIHWASPAVDSGSVTQDLPQLSENATNATYSVTLYEPGDYYEFTIDAVNEGTLDAQIFNIDSRFDGPDGTPIITEGENKNLPAYLEYEVTYADSNHTPIAVNDTLNHGQTKKYRVRVAYSEDIDPSDLEETDITTKFYFAVEYRQKDKTNEPEEPTNPISIVRQNEGQITPGDIVEIGNTEDFYVLSTDNDKTVLLSEYNLKVGIVSGPGFLDVMKPSDAGYGLQSVDAIAGYQWGMQNNIYGGVAFSQTNYWDDNGALKSQYAKDINGTTAVYGGDPYPYVYDNTYLTDPNLQHECLSIDSQIGSCFENAPGYSIAYYVELYKSELIQMGVPSTITARLLTFEEAVSIDSMQVDGKSVIHNGQGYWLASGDDESHVKAFNMDLDDFEFATYENRDWFGVRPVIEIPTSALQ